MATGSRIANNTVAVGTSAVLIKAGVTSRKSVVIQNVHATQVLYIGGSTVATTDGLRLNAGESIELNDYNGPVYGIASGAATDVRYLEIF